MELVSMEPPYFVCHENYYEHLFSVLRRLDGLMDCHVVLSNNEIVPTHSFVLAAFSGLVHSLPRSPNCLSYVVLREADPWGVKSLLEYLHSGSLDVPKHSLTCMNTILQLLQIELGSDFYEHEEIIHFTLNPTLKFNIVNKIWLNRNEQCDVKILTKGLHVTYAHAAILSACSEQLFTLVRAHTTHCKPVLIVLLEFEYQDVETVLKFCYQGEVAIQRNRARFVCELAKVLGIKDLFSTVSDLGHQLKSSQQSNSNKSLSKISNWEHKETTRKIFGTLFEKESLSDIQLICCDHTFKVHSAVLNLSPYFQSLFELNDWRHSLIFLSDLSLETVQAFVDYMYYGEVLFAGSAEEFAISMHGLVDFSVMPVNNVEKVQPEATAWLEPVAAHQHEPCLTDVGKLEPTAYQNGTATYAPLDSDVLPLQSTDDKTSTKVPQEQKTLTYTCDTCSAMFYSRRSLKLHLNTHPESKSSRCSYCDQVFSKPSQRRIHERSHTGSRPYICAVCGKSYSTQSALGKHIRSHEGGQLFECALCSRTCSRKEYLEEHVRTHTGTKPYKCGTCGKRFVGKTGLNHHRKVHEPPRRDSVCEVCGKAFTRKALWTHMKTHDKQYRCETCHKLFSTPATLRAHNAMTHFEEKLYPCDLCDKKFALQNHLNRHKKNVHNPSRLYHCEKCPKVLSSELKLKAHEKSKHSEQKDKSYSCNMCSKKFAGRSALMYHQRTHTGVRPHACGVCTKSFLRPDALQKHLRSHSRERPYRCSLCDQRCSSKSALNKHTKRHKNKPVVTKSYKVVTGEIFNTEGECSKPIKVDHVVDHVITDVLVPCVVGPLENAGPPHFLQEFQRAEGPPDLPSEEGPAPQYIQLYVPSSLTEQGPLSFQ